MVAKRQANGITIKQEAFARAFVETGNASEAYRRSYDVTPSAKPTTIARSAHELMRDPNVASMIRSLQAEVAKRHDITIERVTQMLMEDRDLARKIEQPSAAVSANVALARLHGLIVDKKQVTHKYDPSDLSDSDLAAIATGRGGAAVAAEECQEEPDQLH